MSLIAERPALWDPDGFATGPPHDLLDELRRTHPVYWQDMPGEPGFWAVLTHGDLTAVAREPVLYSASEGGVVLENLDPENLEQMRGMLLAMDPPKHVAYRRPLAPSFTARVIASLEGRIRTICKEINAAAREARDVDFVHDVATLLPSQVVGELMGLPREDWHQIQRWAEMNTSGQDPDIVGEEPAGDTAYETRGAGTMHMAMYAMQFAAQRRTEAPRDDLTSLILAGNFGDGPMSDLEFGIFFVQLVTAGNDTTKTMLSSGLLALLQHPEQLAEVRADRSRLPGAVEEILRYENPLHYFRRTATAASVLHDTEIAEGDKVLMYYTSANRDGSVFADPHRFDIHRSPNPHLSFGIGEHFCLGAHLARLEGRVFFEEVLATFSTIELTGDPVRVRSNLNNGYKRMPMRLTA
jgi:cholest-4-en-3-one 26-monooxygenase